MIGTRPSGPTNPTARNRWLGSRRNAHDAAPSPDTPAREAAPPPDVAVPLVAPERLGNEPVWLALLHQARRPIGRRTRDALHATHFFFDLGMGNTLAYFDLPGLDLGPYAEVLGGHHHLAISIERTRWQEVKDRFDERGVEYAHVDGSSLYFRGPDGERLELISDPLLEMYGKPVG